MTKISRKFIILLYLLFTYSVAEATISSKIIYKINNEIITNIDLENEKKFLLFLNPNLKNLSQEQLKNISKNSLTNRKIKEIELNKFFDLRRDEISKKYIDNFILNSNFTSKEILESELNKFQLQFDYFKMNFTIDNIWREFVFNKFKNQIKINKNKLRNQIANQKNKTEFIISTQKK